MAFLKKILSGYPNNDDQLSNPKKLVMKTNFVFVFAQGMMFLMSKMMPMPSYSMKDDMVLMMIGSLIGHLLFGLFVGLLVPLEEPTGAHDNLKHKSS